MDVSAIKPKIPPIPFPFTVEGLHRAVRIRAGKAISIFLWLVQALSSIRGILLLGTMMVSWLFPQAKAEEVLAEARERMANEESWYKRLSAGETTVEILGLEKAASNLGK